MNEKLPVMTDEKAVEIFKALANQTRVSILQLLKDPENNSAIQGHVSKDSEFEGGVCVGDIHKNTEISQSTTSQYLSILQQSGLLEAKRIGQWTYYRRNEAIIKQFEEYIRLKL